MTEPKRLLKINLHTITNRNQNIVISLNTLIITFL